MTDLLLRNVFPDRPGEDLRLAFRKHVAATGEPETFPQISTERPPKDGAIIVIEHPVDINRKTRIDKGMAPCPICSPDQGKYLNGGSLIWCEATEAIYAIGPRCSTHLWEDGRMDRAINQFNETERARADAAKLRHHIKLIPQYLAWIGHNRMLASTVTNAHTGLAKDMRKLRATLAHSLKSSGGVAIARGIKADTEIGRVKGVPFLSGSWNVGADLDQASLSFRSFPVMENDELYQWSNDLAPSAKAALCKQILQARDALKRAEERMKIASDFLNPGNVRVLGRWGREEGGPIAFTITSTATRITLRHGDAVWQGPAWLAYPEGQIDPIQGWSLAA